jgi:hypothetical protein
MTIVEIIDGQLRVVVEGMDKVLALKSTIEVPLAHVRGASASPDALREPHGLRLLGTSVPGVIAAGSFYDGEWLFMDVHNHAQAVKIELDHEHYAALIVEVEDPAATVSTINAAVRERPDLRPAIPAWGQTGWGGGIVTVRLIAKVWSCLAISLRMVWRRPS